MALHENTLNKSWKASEASKTVNCQNNRLNKKTFSI